MNATAKWLVCGAGLGLALPTAWVLAGTPTFAPVMALAALGDTPADEGALLSQARDAMRQGKLDDANRFIDQAAALKVKHDPRMSRFQDTPDKARADLDKMRSGPQPPSSRFTAWPPAANKGRQEASNDAPRDPFSQRANEATLDKLTDESKSKAQRFLENGRTALRQGDVTSATAYQLKAREMNATFGPNEYSPEQLEAELREAGGQPNRQAAPRFAEQKLPEGDDDIAKELPAYEGRQVNNTAPLTQPGEIDWDAKGTAHDKAPPAQDKAAVPSRSPLADARLALAYGDVRKAADMAKKAREQGLQSQDDSPATIDALIRKSNQLGARPRAGQEAQYARDFAEFLMEQADGLMFYHQFQDAERLAQQAKSLKVRYGKNDRTPDQVLAQLAEIKREQPPQNSTNNVAKNVAPVLPTQDRPPQNRVPQASPQKQHAMQLVSRARAAFDRGDIEAAHRLATEAEGLKVPDREFLDGEMRPWEMTMQTRSRLTRTSGNEPKSNVVPATAVAPKGRDYAVQQGVYQPAKDRSKLQPAQATDLDNLDLPAAPNVKPQPLETAGNANDGSAQQYYDAGMKAFAAGDREGALKNFELAWKVNHQLGPTAKAALKDKLVALKAPRPERLPDGSSSPLGQVDPKLQVLREQLLKEIHAEETAVDKMEKTDPRGGLERMKKLREKINATELDATGKKQLLSFVDRKIGDIDRYIKENSAEIDLRQANIRVKDDIAKDQDNLIERQNKMAKLVEEFNQLMGQNRFAEAEVRAKQANEIFPQEPVVRQMLSEVKLIRNYQESLAIQSRTETGNVLALESVLASGVPIDDRDPYQFGDAKDWKQLSTKRLKLRESATRKRTPVEQEIYKSLSKQVEVNFTNRPLAEVMETLGKMANVNIHLDAAGLHTELVDSSTPVTLNLSTPISLRSALDLILEQHNLSYVIQHEVLKVTSRHSRDSNLVSVVYNVGDLVIPIPNFTPSYDMGLPSAIREGRNALLGGSFANANTGNAGSMQLAAAPGGSNAISPLALAQNGLTGSVNGRGSRPDQYTSGPGSLGGAAAADFDSLIDLITTTVHPESWKEGGTGEGTVSPFPTNLSIVISQTEEVHQQISDLLEQLRRLQDLQVTIEVRFITLNDNFFERIGIDFDFNIDDNTAGIPILPDDVGPSMVVGLDPQGAVTASRDLQFTQNSFSTAIPQFGGFDPATAANFGFAILSDIEVFFLLQASTGDTRTNVLQAPKVTLFNGQQAVVSDTSQRPFVTSVVPVVGDFAAAQQPVITVLSEGTSLSVQAVVTPDRRFVRLTLVPFFSQIGDVEEFTFDGRTTTNTGSSIIDPTNPARILRNNAEQTVQGTTVQLPTFAFTTVTTTVSVPDGGTVLLGGIKRLSEGRTERGVPLLAKVPYISRLFKNVGIGRNTQSLMMMVTPRIIIQEEEEEKVTGTPPG